MGDTHIAAVTGRGGYLEILDGTWTIFAQYTVAVQVRISNAGSWITKQTISCTNNCGDVETKFTDFVVNHHEQDVASDSAWRFLFTCTGSCGPNNAVTVCNPQVCLRPNNDYMHRRPPMSPPSASIGS